MGVRMSTCPFGGNTIHALAGVPYILAAPALELLGHVCLLLQLGATRNCRVVAAGKVFFAHVANFLLLWVLSSPHIIPTPTKPEKGTPKRSGAGELNKAGD